MSLHLLHQELLGLYSTTLESVQGVGNTRFENSPSPRNEQLHYTGNAHVNEARHNVV